MNRQIFIPFILVLLTFHSYETGNSFPASLLSPAVPHFGHLPQIVCRYKKPFPFQSVQLMKKRRSNPPEPEYQSVFHPASPSFESSVMAIPAMSAICSAAPAYPCSITTQPFFAAHWHSCSVARNVFHPPPVAA